VSDLDAELRWLDATAQAALVRSGEASRRELVQSAIDRVEELDGTLNAVTFRQYDRALDEASRATSTDAPFSGVPILIKGLTPCAGQPVHLGNRTLRRKGYMSQEDAPVVRRLRDAGFIVIGQSAAPEMGLVSVTESAAHGITRNPWCTELTSGGSSGGASAAVASGMVPVGHAGDGGGSIRIPATFCHLVGLKVSKGRISGAPDTSEGVWENGVQGVLSRSVRDTAAIVDCIAGYEWGDPTVAPTIDGGLVGALRGPRRNLRIGFVANGRDYGAPVARECAEAVEVTASVLEGLGHEVVESHPRELFETEFTQRFFDVLSPTVAMAVDWIAEKVGRPLEDGELDPITAYWDQHGRSLSGMAMAESLEWLGTFRRRLMSWWANGYDLLLSPTFPVPAPPVSWPWNEDGGIQRSIDILMYTAKFNASGQPAISVPATLTTDGRPVGVQLSAAYGREDLLIAVAAELEKAQPWDRLRPGGPAAGLRK
jgi:amidase